MATQITSGAVADKAGQRRTTRGRLAGDRRLRGVAIIAALALATVAGLALGRALEGDPAGRAPGVAIAGEGAAFTAFREERGPAAAASLPGFTETREDHRLATTIAVAPAARGDRWEREGWARAAAPGFTDFREDHRP